MDIGSFDQPASSVFIPGGILFWDQSRVMGKRPGILESRDPVRFQEDDKNAYFAKSEAWNRAKEL